MQKQNQTIEEWIWCINMLKPIQIGFFGTDGKFGCFSNFYPCQFTYKGRKFNCSEQAFMWEKAITFNDLETANQILVERNPKTIKALGRKVKNFDDEMWSEVREDKMFAINICKYHDNKNLRQILIDTGIAYLFENSPYDSIWGVGKNGDGQNLLGQVLMRVRDYFRNVVGEEINRPIDHTETGFWDN